MDKQFELTTLEDGDLSGVRGGCATCGDPDGGYRFRGPDGGYGDLSWGGGYGDPAGERNAGVGGLIGLGEIDLNVLGIARQ